MGVGRGEQNNLEMPAAISELKPYPASRRFKDKETTHKYKVPDLGTSGIRAG